MQRITSAWVMAAIMHSAKTLAACWVPNNLRERSQADIDLWHGFFDMQTSPEEGVSCLSTKRALSTQHAGRKQGRRLCVIAMTGELWYKGAVSP
jgi:hypothetical protein